MHRGEQELRRGSHAAGRHHRRRRAGRLREIAVMASERNYHGTMMASSALWRRNAPPLSPPSAACRRSSQRKQSTRRQCVVREAVHRVLWSKTPAESQHRQCRHASGSRPGSSLEFKLHACLWAGLRHPLQHSAAAVADQPPQGGQLHRRQAVRIQQQGAPAHHSRSMSGLHEACQNYRNVMTASLVGSYVGAFVADQPPTVASCMANRL